MLYVWDFGEKQVRCMMTKYDSIIGSIVKDDVDVYPLPVYQYLETLLIIWYPRYDGVNWSYTLVHNCMLSVESMFHICFEWNFWELQSLCLWMNIYILKMVDLSGYIMLLAEEQGAPKLFGMLTSNWVLLWIFTRFSTCSVFVSQKWNVCLF